MKIAVYGDSFAAPDGDPRRPSWVQRLAHMHPTWHIHNYAEGGSGLYFSWQVFQRTHTQYDQHIFLVTHWDRWAIPDKSGGYQHLSNAGQLGDTLASSTWRMKLPGWDKQARAQLQVMYDFWTQINTDQQRRHMHGLMLADLQRQAPQALFMPCFCHEDSSLMASPTGITLDHISQIDLNHYLPQHKDSVQFHREWICLRANHVNNINSQLIADSMSQWLTTGSLASWDQQPWGPDPSKPFDWYFKRRR